VRGKGRLAAVGKSPFTCSEFEFKTPPSSIATHLYRPAARGGKHSVEGEEAGEGESREKKNRLEGEWCIGRLVWGSTFEAPQGFCHFVGTPFKQRAEESGCPSTTSFKAGGGALTILVF